MDKKRGIFQGAPSSGVSGCSDAYQDPPTDRQVDGRLCPGSERQQAPSENANATTTADQAGTGTAGAATTGLLTCIQIVFFICHGP